MMKGKKERGLWELYKQDPEKADSDIWDRKPDPVSRRGFIKKTGLATMAIALGSQIPYFRTLPSGLMALALAEADEKTVLKGKEGLIVLNDRPINAEPPAHLLDDDFTPKGKHFVRNNGLPPDIEEKPNQWTFSIEGEVHKPLKLTLDDIKNKFKHYTYALQLECGGNGRAGFYPPAKGNQWKFGAIGCANYKGVRLRDVLQMAELKYSTSPKWLKRILIQNKVHDGMKMDHYRVPKYPVKPGTAVPDKDMAIIESMPVKSLITNPKTGIKIKFGQSLDLRGHAWAGDLSVERMDLSIDFGATWIQANLSKPVNRYAWQNWNATLNFPIKGYYEVWARATDSEGSMQPMVVPGWNPSGYLNNAMHRIAITVF
jgi:DMSO/TMAO reductase YedYZ molybdopterin-dependent catalytic subunit